ncbi:hypothetical protein G7Z17_g5022 [Cylindrodendrum hubeiense]|uniref:F-box domain-containing protein n=1 Tax=Cylindrodendrum hubeiense TaxID=595255 RepID=A0A9P5H9S1_9HYPO|nr:hypothetical protein G7Z17_g5022 [Cylindrodendrum hubeiense]
MVQKDGDGSQVLLTTLPTEILDHIIKYVDLASHLDFACSCKVIANCAQPILKRHQDAYQKYRNLSDLSPLTVPTLLRSVVEFADPISVWHVRSFDIWGSRMGWEHWRPFDVQESIFFNGNIDPLKWSYQSVNTDDYLPPFQGKMSVDELDMARSELKNGHDGFMKMLLISMCPRLRDLKFINSEPEKTSLGWLARAIAWHRLGESWPEGFKALRDVAVGVPWTDMHIYQHSESALDNILHLPNIDSIYYSGFSERGMDDSENDDNEDSDEDDADTCPLPPGCSSVRHIFLDHLTGMSRDYSEALVTAPRELISMSFRETYHLDYVDNIVKTLGPSVQSLMFYKNRGLHGYRCSAYQPDEVAFAARHLSIDIRDVELAGYGECVRDNGRDLDHDSFVEYFAERAFPESLEVLVLWESVGAFIVKDGDGIQFLEDAVIALIESGDHPNLKAVYLDEVEASTDEPRADRICFQKAIAAGVRAGVDVHTHTNRNQMTHAVEFPQAPDPLDIASGPISGRRPTSWRFNVHSGRLEPPGCDSCGKCHSCLSVYTKELWESI